MCRRNQTMHEDIMLSPIFQNIGDSIVSLLQGLPDGKVHGANVRPIWGRQDPGGPHVGPMSLTIWAEELIQSDCVTIMLHYTYMLSTDASQFVIIYIHEHWHCISLHRSDIAWASWRGESQIDCLFNRLFRLLAKKIAKLLVTGLCEGIQQSPVDSLYNG